MQRQQPKTITLLERKLLVNGASHQGAQSNHAPRDKCGFLGDALVTHARPQQHARQLWSMLSLVDYNVMACCIWAAVKSAGSLARAMAAAFAAAAMAAIADESEASAGRLRQLKSMLALLAGRTPAGDACGVPAAVAVSALLPLLVLQRL